MKYPVCPINNCYGKQINKEEKKKGTMCIQCQYEYKKKSNQKVLCKCCNDVYIIREKIRESEEEFIIAGYCYWCKQRKEEEDELIKQGLLNESDRTTDNFQRNINKIINKKE